MSFMALWATSFWFTERFLLAKLHWKTNAFFSAVVRPRMIFLGASGAILSR